MREKEAAETKKREADRRGTAISTMGPMWTRGVSTGGGLCRGLPYVPRGTVPKFPVECPFYVYIAWERRFEVFIANQGLRHTISPDAPEIAVISCINGCNQLHKRRIPVWTFRQDPCHRPQTGMGVHFRSDCWRSV